jgi:hypothetical protein
MLAQPLAIDVETVGLPWDGFVPAMQEYLLERARDDDEREAFPEQLALYPGTARVVAIGMWMPGEQRGGVLVNDSAGTREWSDLYDGARVFHGGEVEILEEFWQRIQSFETIVTYNGRTFDCPILMLRSAVLGVAPSRNLMPYRYSFQQHCDLLEVLSFHRAVAPYTLQFWCQQFGIADPKAGLSGSAVPTAFAEGRYDDIARYCLKDACATAELYEKLLPLIETMEPKTRG